MDSLEERLAEVEWWIPWIREFQGVLLLTWLVVVPGLVVWGSIVLLRMWRARRAGEIGPQAYRWRSAERFRYFGNIAVSGCFIVPMLLMVLTFGGLLLGAFLVDPYVSYNTSWNLWALASLVFWFCAYRWLYQRVRAGVHEPESPDFGEDLPGEPLVLDLWAASRDRR